MKKLLRILSLASSAILFTSCLQHEMTIHVKPDGSGTIVEETRIGAAMIQMMEQMAAGLGGNANQNDPLKDMVSEEKANKRASELGQGVTLEKVEPVELNGSKGARATYRFNDITKLTLSTSEGVKSMPKNDPEAGFGAQQPAAKQDPIRFEFSDGELTVRMPEAKANAATKPETPANTPQMDDPQGIATMKQMFGDMKMAIRIKADPGIASTDATHRDGDTVTLMEMDFGKLIENADNLKKLATINQNEPQKALEMFKGIEGVRFEAKPVIKIKVK